MASPAVYTCCLPKKAALKSGAEKPSMITANASCGRISKAFLAILEPERQGRADSVLKNLTSEANRERFENSGSVVAKGLVRFHRVEIGPGLG